MRATRPPRLSTWLLERFVGGPRRESLVGDLLEQYPRRRSAAWYWRQVITTIMVSGARDISAHKSCREVLAFLRRAGLDHCRPSVSIGA
jgi:hypothetical protein